MLQRSPTFMSQFRPRFDKWKYSWCCRVSNVRCAQIPISDFSFSKRLPFVHEQPRKQYKQRRFTARSSRDNSGGWWQTSGREEYPLLHSHRHRSCTRIVPSVGGYYVQRPPWFVSCAMRIGAPVCVPLNVTYTHETARETSTNRHGFAVTNRLPNVDYVVSAWKNIRM